MHGLPATLLVSVDAAPLPDTIAIRALAESMAAVLADKGMLLHSLT